MYRGTVRTLLVVIALAVTAGCGGEGDEAASSAVDPAATTLVEEAAAVTTTLPAGPPCFGLVQVDQLPEGWAVLLNFDVADWMPDVGCEIEAGVLRVSEDGHFRSAFVDACASFESTDIPSEDLWPASNQRWVCHEVGEASLSFTQREG